MSPAHQPAAPTRVLLSRGLTVSLSRSEVKKKVKKADQRCKDCQEVSEVFQGPEVFADWVRENSEAFWNPCLVQGVKGLEFRGVVQPSTLLVGGSDYCLEVVRSAWGRRMLRPPRGYDIVMLGDLDPVSSSLVPQTQFAPLPEALCKVVFDLASDDLLATLPVIGRRLKVTFPQLKVPSDDVLYKALGALIRERKLYHSGRGYCVVTPDSFRLLATSPPLMLLSNEQAIARLHPAHWSSDETIHKPRKNGAAVGKLKRCHSLKLLRGKDKERLSRSNSFKSSSPVTPDLDASHESHKKEKPQSLLSKWFRRGRSEKAKAKGETPRDRSDPEVNSRSTQTTADTHRTKGRSSSLNRTLNKDRHSQHFVCSTPTCHRSSSNRHLNPADPHFRSSSLTRKSSASPRREQNKAAGSAAIKAKSSTVDPARMRQKYDSPFVPYIPKSNTQPLLMASDKYDDTRDKVSPYQSTDLLKNHANPFQPPALRRQDAGHEFMSSTLRHKDASNDFATSTLRNRDASDPFMTSTLRNKDTSNGFATLNLRNQDYSNDFTSSLRNKDTSNGFTTSTLRNKDTSNGFMTSTSRNPDYSNDFTSTLRNKDTSNGFTTSILRNKDTSNEFMTSTMRNKEGGREFTTPAARTTETNEGQRPVNARSQEGSSDFTSFPLPSLRNSELNGGWRRPTSLLTPLQLPSIHVTPRFSSTPAGSEVKDTKTLTSRQTIESDFKTSKLDKEIRLGTTVDVEICVGEGKKLADSSVNQNQKNDLLKIATSWNQSYKRPSTDGVKVTPKVTTTTNITTSVSQTSQKAPNIGGSSLADKLKATLLASDERDVINSPRSTSTCDAKSDVFSDDISPNTTTEVHLTSKDDSGFSSCASTSRPMSVSPC